MTVTYYIRDKRKGNFSIENVFQPIYKELSSYLTINYFYVDPRVSKLRNIINASKVQGDINHITGDVNWLCFGLDPTKTILTVHDIGHLTNTLTGIKKLIYKKLWWQWPLKRIRWLTAISEFTAQELTKELDVDKEQVEVIHNPMPFNSMTKVNYKQSPCPKILQIGTMPNKNLKGLIEAVRELRCKLVLLRKPDETILQLLKINNILFDFHFDLSDSEVICLYEQSDILFFASTYEGFGMPIIEAQALGVPVITSNICSMPEVAGDGALYVNPYDIHEIRNGIEKIISDEHYRNEIVKKGYENISRFHPSRIAQKYLNLYQSIASI